MFKDAVYFSRSTYGTATAATLEVYFDVLNSKIFKDNPKYEVQFPILYTTY